MAPDPSREREGERRRLTWCDTCQGPWLSLRFCSHPKQQGTRRPTSWTSPRRCSKCRRGKERPRRTTRSGLLTFAGGWKGTRREDRPKMRPFPLRHTIQRSVEGIHPCFVEDVVSEPLALVDRWFRGARCVRPFPLPPPRSSRFVPCPLGTCPPREIPANFPFFVPGASPWVPLACLPSPTV